MFALADGGTLLLDEIGDMDFKLQAKLLQVLQDQEFQRLGGKDTVKVNVRVIAATHCNLEKAIAEGRFREDLYYRLNVIDLRVPPLRERREDILPLAEFLVRKHGSPGAPAAQLPPSLENLFLRYHWPGNVRELENLIRRFLVLRSTRSIELELLCRMQSANGDAAQPGSDGLSQPTPAVAHNGVPGDEQPLEATSVLDRVARANREAERVAIVAALKATNWNRKQAAVLLRVDYKALLYKMKKLSIRKEKAVPQLVQPRPEAVAATASAGSDQMPAGQATHPVFARRAIG